MAERYQAPTPWTPERACSHCGALTAQRVSIDSAGRMLTQESRSLLSLERDLYLFTAGSWFELWDRTCWTAQAYPQAADLWEQLNGLNGLTLLSRSGSGP